MRVAGCGLRTADCGLGTVDCGIEMIRNAEESATVPDGQVLGNFNPRHLSERFFCYSAHPALARRLPHLEDMNDKTRDLQARTQRFYLRVIELVESLPPNIVTERVIPQLLDSAGSTDNNYRAACRGRTNREFIAKLGIVVEEADESKAWLEALAGAEIGDPQTLKELIQEADELVAIFTTSQKTSQKNAAKRSEIDKLNKRRRRRRG